MGRATYAITFGGGLLQRGFWLYVWAVTTANGEQLLYVGRTGDSSSSNAQSPFNRMGQHLGFARNSSMLRNHLESRNVDPEQCTFRLIAHGPILHEAANTETHQKHRDVIAAMERQLAEDLADAGYVVMNAVASSKPLDRKAYEQVRAAFAHDLPRLWLRTPQQRLATAHSANRGRVARQ